MENWTQVEKAIEEGDYLAAIEALRLFLQKYPTNSEAWARLAACLNDASKAEEAIEASRKAIDFDSTNVLAWVQLGWSLKANGSFEKAIEKFEQALDLSGMEHDWILTQISHCYNQLDKGLQGLEYAIRALNKNPSFALAKEQQLVSLNILSRFQEARVIAIKLIEETNDSEMGWCQKGWAEKKLEDYKAAAISFHHAIALNPDDAWNWAQYAMCCNKIGKFSEAEKAAERVLELDPSSSVAQRVLRQALSSKEPRPILFE